MYLDKNLKLKKFKLIHKLNKGPFESLDFYAKLNEITSGTSKKLCANNCKEKYNCNDK